MKTYKIATAWFIVGIMLMSACKTHYDCPAFDEANMQHLPYRAGDTITFFSPDSAVFQIFVKSENKSEAYSYDCKDLYDICICTSYVKLVVTDSEQNADYVLINMEQNDRNDANIFYYELFNLFFEFDYENDLSHLQYFENIELIGNHAIGDDIYSQVLRLTDTDEEKSMISWVYFNKSNGILQFKMRATGVVWAFAGTK